MANPMENNKAVMMLRAAEEGGYGVIGVVSVRFFPIQTYDIHTDSTAVVQSRNNSCGGQGRRS
jgi:hypothetical protein